MGHYQKLLRISVLVLILFISMLVYTESAQASAQLSVETYPEEVTIEPGGVVSLSLEVLNTGTNPSTVSITIEGLPDSVMLIDVSGDVKIQPGEVGIDTFLLSVDKGASEGTYHPTMVVTSGGEESERINFLLIIDSGVLTPSENYSVDERGGINSSELLPEEHPEGATLPTVVTTEGEGSGSSPGPTPLVTIGAFMVAFFLAYQSKR
ncbi:MAG: hypothetical protein ACXQS2_01540 [Methermicoccaceae archaeon]